MNPVTFAALRRLRKLWQNKEHGMDESLYAFLKDSPLADRVKLRSRVVVQRAFLSPREILSIQAEQKYGPVPKKQRICELEAGGRVLARGKIVKRKGEYYFKVLEKPGKEDTV